MCQIVYAPNKTLLIMEDLEKSQETNSDGFGITYAKDNKLFYCKKMGDFELLKKALALVPDDVPLVIHFRFTTHGETTKLNIHPFEVLNKLQGDAVDLCMAHNGTISSIHTHGEKKSDTHLYVEKILKPILKESPDLIFNEAFQLLVQRDIGSHNNKFIFLRGDGKVVWINKNLGHVPKDRSELWYANEYSLKGRTRYSSSNSYRGHTSQESRSPTLFPGYGGHGVSGSSVVNTASSGTNVTTLKQKENLFEHPNTKFFNLFETEKDLPDEIKAHLKEGEGLLVCRAFNKVSLQGWGWVQYSRTNARWNKELAPIHKRWKLATCPELRKELGIEEAKPMDTTGTNTIPETPIEAKLAQAELELAKDFERKYDERNFRLLTENELLNWVLEFPDEACAWAAKNGFYGSQKKIFEWLNDANGAADFLTDFIHKASRKLPTKSLEELEEALTKKKAS